MTRAEAFEYAVNAAVQTARTGDWRIWRHAEDIVRYFGIDCCVDVDEGWIAIDDELIRFEEI